MKQAIITTTNEAWGFFGTTLSNEGATEVQAAADFNDAGHALIEALGVDAEMARAYLDSRRGRHLADARQAGESARDLTLRCAKEWKVSMLRDVRDLRAEMKEAK